MTFFLQFFPDVIRSGHLYILQTPLFRVRNKKETRYCYSEEERLKAVDALGPIRKSPDLKVWARFRPTNSKSLSARRCGSTRCA